MATTATDTDKRLKLIQALYPVCELSAISRRKLAERATLEPLKAHVRLQAEEDAGWISFVVAGEVELVSDKGSDERITAGSPRARLPLFKFHPPGHYAQANSNSIILRVSRALYKQLHELERHAASGDEGSEIVLGNSASGEDDSPLYTRIYRAYSNDELPLPSLPDVALQIREAIKDADVGVKDVAKMVLADPVLSARLIHVANSAAYRRNTPATTVYQAVTRLGLEASQNIALSLSLKHLFQADSPLLKQRMQALYTHSSLVASLSYVLARHSAGFNAERALLIGLLHDIGIIPILAFADRHANLMHDEAELDRTIGRLRALTSHLVLSRLGFDPEIITAAEEAEEWLRDPQPEPDYGDLIVVAQLHSYLGTPQMANLPRIDETPAYRKLDLGEFDPKQGLRILQEADSVTAAIRQTLH